MQNITFSSLHLFSLYSISPFYSINQNCYRQFLYVSNSYFSHSFTNIFISNSQFHSSTVKNTVFACFLSTPLVFSKQNEGYCRDGSTCCVSKEYYFKLNQTIHDLAINNSSFPDEFLNKNMYFGENCGDIRIFRCLFDKCYSSISSGGGIRIEQYCNSLIHTCIFNQCFSYLHGGAAAIATLIVVDSSSLLYSPEPQHLITSELIMIYNCFQDCYLYNNDYKYGYGSSLIVGAEYTQIHYSSTIYSFEYERKISWGAEFDILGKEINTKYINCTGGNSYYCGGIEYRNVVYTTFMYNTLTNIMGKYIIAFTFHEDEFQYENENISYCNIYNNTILDRVDRKLPYPSLIFYNGCDIVIENFYFYDNNFTQNGNVAGTIADEYSHIYEIFFIKCYALYYDEYKFMYEFATLISCYFNDSFVQTLKISHLQLGKCEGEIKITPDILPLTPTYTESSIFTESKSFTASNTFSPSDIFSGSSIFTQSYKFGQTFPFTPSHSFTPSNSFTGSNYFTNSNFFSNSQNFSPSIFFSSSQVFTFSNVFSQTLNRTSTFTPTQKFSQSSLFSLSNIFSLSDIFSNSDIFKPTPTQSNFGHVKSNLMSYSYSFLLVKSVSMSFSCISSNIFSLTYNKELGEYSYVLTVITINKQFPYVIQFLSPTIVQTVLFVEMDKKKNSLSPNQLIGIVCGSVGVFFALLGIIIFVLRKKKSFYGIDDFDYFTSSSDLVVTQKTKESEVQFDVPDLNKNEIDDWL